VKVREYEVMALAVKNGVSYGWHQAHKYTVEPAVEAIFESIERAVMAEVCDWFVFEEVEMEEQLPVPRREPVHARMRNVIFRQLRGKELRGVSDTLYALADEVEALENPAEGIASGPLVG
jgi:hypothetical protein